MGKNLMARYNMPVAACLLEMANRCQESPEAGDLLTNLCKQMNENSVLTVFCI